METREAAPHRLSPAHVRPQLDPAIDILLRRDGAIQLGWDPDRAVVLCPPPLTDPQSILEVLRLIDGSRSVPELTWSARRHGMNPEVFDALLVELRRAGMVTDSNPRRSTTRVLVVGRGPLSDAIASGLRGVARVARHPWSPSARPQSFAADCVVIADHLVPPPELVRILTDAGTAHLPVRLRDGRGLIGPLVLPGRSICLRCVDLTRCDCDPGWPYLAAQMVARVGWGSPAMVAITAAVAITQVEALFADLGDPPTALGATLHVTPHGARIRSTSWAPHPLCQCIERADGDLRAPAALIPR